MKLKYRDFVSERTLQAMSRIIATKPAPLVDVSHSFVINTRRIEAALDDFREARKAIITSGQEEVLQYKTVLFFSPEGVSTDGILGIAGDKSRLRKALSKKEKREDGSDILELDWMPKEELENILATDVFSSIDFESINTPTEPVCIDGMLNFVVIQDKAERGWVPSESREQLEKDINELLDTDVDVEIRVVTGKMLEKSQEKRPEFEIQTNDMLLTWFMFEAD